MPEYLATVRHADGRKVTENVVADSADQALKILRARGHEDVVLHTDDVSALFVHQRAKADDISPRDYVVLRNLRGGLGLFVVITVNGYRKLAILMVLVALVLAYNRYLGQPWGPIDWPCVLILLSPPLVALAWALFGSRGRARHQQMMDALYSGRWEETLQRAERVSRRHSAHVIALARAQTLAGMDRLDEALRLLEPFGDGKAVPAWFYHSMLAQVYEFARRRDDAIAQLEQAVTLAPDNATLLLALARHVIWHKRDAKRARELLAQASAHALSDLTASFADLQEGLILLEEGRPRDALPILEAALKIFRSRSHMPLGYLPVEQTTLALALTRAALGERDEALALYAKVRPRLVALRSHVLDRCDRSLGVPQDQAFDGV